MLIAFAIPGTFTGTSRSTPVPSPTWPTGFWPQAHTVPPSSRARLWFAPAATCTAGPMPFTRTGTNLTSVPRPPRLPPRSHPRRTRARVALLHPYEPRLPLDTFSL